MDAVGRLDIIRKEIGNSLDGFIEWECVEEELNKLTKEKVLTIINKIKGYYYGT